MLALAIAVASSTAAPQWYRDGQIPSPETVMAAVAACGIGDAMVEFDDELQESIVILPPTTVMSDEKLDCIAETSFETGYFFDLPSEYATAFFQRRDEFASPWNVELARQLLEEQGLLADLPLRADDETDQDFAWRLESYCHAEGALSSAFGSHVISPDWVQLHAPDMAQTGAAAFCLSNAGTASEFQIFLVGNGLLAEDDVESD